MKNALRLSIAFFVYTSVVVWADTFGTFNIDFVPISGDASSANGTDISSQVPGSSRYKTFTDPTYNYRMGVCEITNDQWTKFLTAYGTGYANPSWTGLNVPANNVSWYEAAQFVNWLNVSTGHQEAYNFTGTQGSNDYMLDIWDVSEAWGGTNLYRHKDTFYFLPTEDEWVKAAYWNGTALQTYATIDDSLPVAGVVANYDDVIAQPWNVGSGSEELNGTFDMMGNVGEWTESPYHSGDYVFDSSRCFRGGAYNFYSYHLSSSDRGGVEPDYELINIGFRVASIPEPATLFLLALGSFFVGRRRK